jgi:C-terminal processing protease CtpA/Prc
MKTGILLPKAIAVLCLSVFSFVNLIAQEESTVQIKIQIQYKNGEDGLSEKEEYLEGSFTEKEIKEIVNRDKDDPTILNRKVTVTKRSDRGNVEVNTYYYNNQDLNIYNQDEGTQKVWSFSYPNMNSEDQKSFEDKLNNFRLVMPGAEFTIEDFMPYFNMEDFDFADLELEFSNPSLFYNQSFLGVYTDEASGYEGVLIKDIVKDSPAEKAGIQTGDIVSALNDIPVNDVQTLQKIIRENPKNEPIKIKLHRNNEELVLFVTPEYRSRINHDQVREKYIEEKFEVEQDSTPSKKRFKDLFSIKSKDQKVRLGVTVENMVNYKGLKVMDVSPDSPAAKAGIQKYDVIEKFDKQKVNDVKQLQSLVTDKIGEVVLVQIRRDGKKIKTKVVLQ